jgi:hypothetical protein
MKFLAEKTPTVSACAIPPGLRKQAGRFFDLVELM